MSDAQGIQILVTVQLDKMANRLDNNGNSLRDAVEKADVKKLKSLLKSSEYLADDNITALHLALESGNKSVINMLLEKRPNLRLKNAKGENSLHVAAKIGVTSFIELFLERGVGINLATKDKLTPLHVAVKHNRIETVKLLLGKKAKVNTQNAAGDTPLHEAVANRSIPLIELLLSHGADPNCTNAGRSSAFHASFELRDKDVTSLFLDHDVNVCLRNDSGENALHLASMYSSNEVVELLLSMNMSSNKPASDGRTPLHYAVENLETHAVAIVDSLLAAGANLAAKDGLGKTALYTAVERRRLRVAKFLVSKGASVDGPIASLSRSLSTPLFAALENGQVDAVGYLLEHEAQVNVKNAKNEGPIHVALRVFANDHTTRYRVVLLLLDAGANVNDRDSTNSTALHRVIEMRDTALFDLLVARGASVDLKNFHHETPLYMAVKTKNSEAARVLLEAGASVADHYKHMDTKLTVAVNNQDKSMIRLLLDYKVRVNDGTSVHWAARKGDVSIMELLVKKGIDLNSIERQSTRSVLVIAIQWNQPQMVRYLLENGADVNYVDRRKCLPISHAREVLNLFRADQSSTTVVTYILKHLALLAAKNLYVHERNVTVIGQSHESWKNMYETYNKELARMKIERVCSGVPVKFFDVLVKQHNALVECLRCSDVRTVLAKGDYKQKFPNYRNFMEENYNRGFKRLQMIDRFQMFLGSMFKSELPYDVRYKISECLSDEDFEIWKRLSVEVLDITPFELVK